MLVRPASTPNGTYGHGCREYVRCVHRESRPCRERRRRRRLPTHLSPCFEAKLRLRTCQMQSFAVYPCTRRTHREKSWQQTTRIRFSFPGFTVEIMLVVTNTVSPTPECGPLFWWLCSTCLSRGRRRRLLRRDNGERCVHLMAG